MKLGLFSINTGPCADPDVMTEVAIAAEAAGFDSLWTAEHVVLPDPQVAPSPSAPLSPMLDPAVALAYVASCTTSIKLATGIVILPQRNPLVLAKEFASLDVLSKGRVILGIAAGYLRPEFDALHTPFNDRGGRVEDALAAMRAIWTMDDPSHEGPYWSFSGVQSRPRPVQSAVPIVMGGRSEGAMSRSVRLSDGWYGFALDIEKTRTCTDELAAMAGRVERPANFGRLEISVTPPPKPLTRELVAEYEALGVDRLVVLPRGSDQRDDLLRLIDASAAAVSDS
jgi:probable F420-dependent oxidoreductase